MAAHGWISKCFMGVSIRHPFAGPLRNAVRALARRKKPRSANRMAAGKTVPAFFQTGSQVCLRPCQLGVDARRRSHPTGGLLGHLSRSAWFARFSRFASAHSAFRGLRRRLARTVVGSDHTHVVGRKESPCSSATGTDHGRLLHMHHMSGASL